MQIDLDLAPDKDAAARRHYKLGLASSGDRCIAEVAAAYFYQAFHSQMSKVYRIWK